MISETNYVSFHFAPEGDCGTIRVVHPDGSDSSIGGVNRQEAMAVVAGLIDRGLHPQRPPDTDEVRDVIDRLLFFPDEPGE